MQSQKDESPYSSAEDISSDSFSPIPSPTDVKPSKESKEAPASSSVAANTIDEGPQSFQLHSLLDDDDESLKDVKLLRENFFSKPYSKNSGSSSKKSNLQDVVHDVEENVTNLPANYSNLSIKVKGEETSLRPSVERPCHTNANDKIRLRSNIPIRPEDKIIEGPHANYNDQVSIRGGGNETFPDTNVTLKSLGILEEIIANLNSMGIVTLKKIQENIVPLILKGNNDIVAYAKTGHGKTFSYLIPIINNIVSENRREPPTEKKPRVVILLQNHETAVQVYGFANKIAQGLDLNVIPAIGCNNMNSELEKIRHEGGDIVIGTTGRFIHYISEKKIPLDKIKTIVFDEADLFLKDKDWQRSMKIFRYNMPYGRRTFLFSATYDDQSCYNFYSFVRHDCWFVAVGELNQVEDLVRQTFMVDKLINHDKMLIRLLIEKAKNDRCPKTLVFTNSMDKADWIAGRLRLFKDIPCSFEIRAASLHSAIPIKDRDLIFKAFLLPFEDPTSIDVIVASDKISCGVSTPAELVVNYDIPNDIFIYILRVGRTGRNGHRGEAYTFIDSGQFKYYGYDQRSKLCSMLAVS
uniref:ATP-dependent RNA helicase n=1 Tax=Panagrolaimus sp. ES5 TaxID=591445 RepID=A0AC34FXB6_9BILA